MGNIVTWLEESIEYETINDEKGSILHYDSMYAITLGWFFPRDGSVFSFLEFLMLTSASVIIIVAMGYLSCDNYPSLGAYCVPLPSPNTTYLTLITLCSFVTAFFANSVLERWWTLREILQSTMGACIEVTLLLSNVTKTVAKNAKSREQRDFYKQEAELFMNRVVGLCVTTLELLFYNAREETDITPLLQKEITSKQELEYFGSLPKAAPIHSIARLSDYIHELARRGLLGDNTSASEAMMMTIYKSLFNMRSGTSNVLLYIDVQIPYPFVQIISAVVYAFLIQLFFICAAFVSQGIKTGKIADIITGVLTIILYNLVLLGLLRLFDVLSNPLGDDVADFPHTTYIKKIEKTLRDITKSTLDNIDSVAITEDEAAIANRSFFNQPFESKSDVTINIVE